MSDDDNLVAGRYRLVNRLAAGGMGTVWEGWDELLQRPVAIKQLHAQPGVNEIDRDLATHRAMREARITARLHHPHAVPVYDVVDDGGRPCLIMQFLPSTSLQELIKQKGALDPAAVARIGAQSASALAAAHQAGIVHRDVKPGNVLIAEDGSAKITDFGISHALDDISLTSTGMVSGTPAYLAPEVARGVDSTFASDVFSLGSTLYVALEGNPPFGLDPNPMAMLHKVASGRINPPTRSATLTPLLMRMLDADPARRPPMVDVARELGRISDLAGTASTATTQRLAGVTPPPEATTVLPSVPPPARPPGPPVLPVAAPPAGRPDQPKRRSRLPLLLVLVALVVVALVIVIAAVVVGNDDNGEQAGGALSTAPSRSASSSVTSSAAGKSTSARPSPKSSSRASSTRASSSASTSRSSPPPSSTSATSSASPGAPTSGQLAGAVGDYYALLPGNTDAGWARLTSNYQQSHAGGRSGYDGFWRPIDRVTVSDSAGDAPSRATATITYHYSSGKVVEEETSFVFVRQDGVLKIDQTTVDSSHSR